MELKVKTVEGHYSVESKAISEIVSGIEKGDVIITDHNVLAACPQLNETQAHVFSITPGEESKCFHQYHTLVDQILSAGFLRNGTIYAVGGGVIGDIAGFVASTVHRGVRLLQVPTSLLAMVDSSVGGKVGIDMPQGKNLLGSFYNPAAVYIDTKTLQTLPREHFDNGMAEVIKYGWILDAELLENLSREELTAESAGLDDLIFRCIALKRDVVEADFQEKSGVRAILNFGHTVGHALEAQVKYQGLLHGQAIAIGMVAEVGVAKELGITSLVPADIEPIFVQYHLPIQPTHNFDLDGLVRLMLVDKKSTGNGIAMSLVTEPGECKLVDNIEPALVRGILANLWS